MSRLQPKKLTHAQERDIEQSERLHARAAILKAGVRAALSLDYPGPYDLQEAIIALSEAKTLDDQGWKLKSSLSVNPGRAKR